MQGYVANQVSFGNPFVSFPEQYTVRKPLSQCPIIASECPRHPGKSINALGLSNCRGHLRLSRSGGGLFSFAISRIFQISGFRLSVLANRPTSPLGVRWSLILNSMSRGNSVFFPVMMPGKKCCDEAVERGVFRSIQPVGRDSS